MKAKTCIMTLEGHTYSVKKLALFNNRVLCSALEDSKIKLWDIKSGKCINILEGHEGSVYDIKILPNGSLISVGKDKAIRIWYQEDL